MEFDRKSLEAYIDTVVSSHAPDMKVPDYACLVEGGLEPCAMVIFGATGDLTARKLAPALYNLYLIGGLPDSFAIVGAARSEMSNDEFRDRMKSAVAPKDGLRWDRFAERLIYRRVEFDSPESYARLAATLEALNKERGLMGNRIFYLAIPPSLYEKTVELLGDAGLSRAGDGGKPWPRVVIEKPFGRNLNTAVDLDRTVRKHFRESQVFRIDHYLAKETVQNLLVFRFGNAIFEPLWNRMFIDSVHITAAESLGIENRAHYYEESGVLRDMFQNHMMQLLALTAMEPPSRFEADHVRDETCKVFGALRPFSEENADRDLILAQYGGGESGGREVPAYRDEPGVDPKSLTPTFAMMKVFIENWRWEGVPFYLTSGKRLAEKVTEIVINFKSVPHSMFRDVLGEGIQANRLTLGVYPRETINLTFQTKNPGAKFCLRSVTMDFDYQQNYSGPVLDAYDKALLDCMQGDQTLFWRQDAVELCWSFLEPVLEDCEGCMDRYERLLFYPAGSWGPAAANSWRD